MKYYNSTDYIKKRAAEIVPSMRYDGKENFLEWQEKARTKLSELLGLHLFEKCDDDFSVISERKCEGYTQIDFEFQSEEGYYIPAVLLVPDNIKRPMPGIICLQGHTTGMHISLGLERFYDDIRFIKRGSDFALQAVKEGFCAIAFDQRYMGKASHQTETDTLQCNTYPTFISSLLGRCTLAERVWDVKRAIDITEKYFGEYINPERIMCMGQSGGGTACLYASCIDERIYLSMPSGAVCSFRYSITKMRHCPCNYVPGMAQYFDLGDIGGLIAPRRLNVVCGIQDNGFLIEGTEESFELIQKAYKAVGKEHLCNLVRGPENHQFYPDLAWPDLHKLLAEKD